MDVEVHVYTFLKLCLGIATRGSFDPWIGLHDRESEGFFQWSDGSAGEVDTEQISKMHKIVHPVL